MTSKDQIPAIFRKTGLTIAVFIVLFVFFGLYVYTEKQIDRANELRQISYQLADQLRQSSDDLTRMARTYVGTGEPRYRKYYQDILDIRDGRKPQPDGYVYAYWDMVLANIPPPHTGNGQAVALLDLMRQAGFTSEEFGKLAEAKENSDSLAALELKAMELVSSAGTEAGRVKANLMLIDDNYHQAKAKIMRPINEFYLLMDSRTLAAVHTAEKTALGSRVLFIAASLLAIFTLWRSYVALRATLGGGIDEVATHIARLGHGDFSSAIPIATGAENSVLGWLSLTQVNLARIDAERKHAENSLRENEARLAAILNNVLDGIITIDEIGTVKSFNESAEKIFGYIAAEAIGSNIKMLMPEPYHSQHDGYLHNYVSTGFKKIIGIGRQVVGQRKDGSTFPLDLAVSEMQLGSSRMFIGIVRDITTSRKAEEELRKLSRAIEQSPVSVLITDADGVIEYVNAKFSGVTGYAAHEAIGRNPRFMQSGSTPNGVYQSMWQTVMDGREWCGKLQNRKKNGELFWEEMHISAIRDSEGKATHFVAVKEDITERMKIERMKIERMKSEFVSTVSHELRTPLTSIRGALALIAGGVVGELPAAVKPLVDIAHKNSERLILLVNDILDMEKIESGKMEFRPAPIELMPLLKQALEGNHAYAKQFNVTYQLEGELPGVMVNVDANRLMQVLANLLSNAAKFSPPGDQVTIAATSDGKRVRVAVSNHGSGIPEQFRSRVFEKFAQADSSDTRKKGGTGLGLSITRAIVEQMGGSIGFDSQPDVLTTFLVEFPVWQDAAAAAPETREAGMKKRVLICEDDHDIAALLRLMLEQSGLAADIAYNATQAKQMLTQHSYAAMTLDLALPDQGGIALIRELRTNPDTAELPIVVVSANAAEGRKELDGEAFNVVDWICKPINQGQLSLAIKQALNQLSDVRPRVLHVEDDPDIFRVVKAIVGEFAELDNASTLADARRMLENNHYELAILDMTLPDGSGMELLPVLNAAKPPTPVMVFSAREMALEDVREVRSVLVKSRTDNMQLLATIKRLIGVE